MTDRSSTLLSVLLVLLACAAVYAGVRGNDFVSFDDNLYVTENEHVLAGLTGAGVAWAFTVPIVLWMFAETFAGVIGENMTVIITRYRALVRTVLTTALILLLPLIAMQFTDEVVWDLADFVVAGILLIGAGLTFELIARKVGSFAYRAAVGIAVASALLLIWVSLAVGIIGDGGNPANLMYLGVLAVGIAGAVVARFQPHGMARALFAMALAQILIAVITLITGLDQTFVMTVFFVVLWLASAWLFRRSGEEPISKG